MWKEKREEPNETDNRYITNMMDTAVVQVSKRKENVNSVLRQFLPNGPNRTIETDLEGRRKELHHEKVHRYRRCGFWRTRIKITGSPAITDNRFNERED